MSIPKRAMPAVKILRNVYYKNPGDFEIGFTIGFHYGCKEEKFDPHYRGFVSWFKKDNEKAKKLIWSP